jgi:hypothetical protein
MFTPAVGISQRRQRLASAQSIAPVPERFEREAQDFTSHVEPCNLR